MFDCNKCYLVCSDNQLTSLTLRASDFEENVFSVVAARLSKSLKAFTLYFLDTEEGSDFVGLNVGEFLSHCKDLQCVAIRFLPFIFDAEMFGEFGHHKRLRYMLFSFADLDELEHSPESYFAAYIANRNRLLVENNGKRIF